MSKLLDANLQLQDDQTFTSTNVGEVGGSAATVDVSAIRAVPGDTPVANLVIQIEAIDTGDGNETYEIKLEFAAASGFSTVTHSVSLTISEAEAVEIPVPLLNDFARLNYTIGGTTPSLNLKGAYLTWFR